MDVFKFTFELTQQDYLDFNMFWVKTSKYVQKQIRTFRILFALLPFLVLFLSLDTDRMDVFIITLVFFSIISILLFVYLPALHRAFTLMGLKRMLAGQRNNNLGERTVRFEENRILHKTAYEDISMSYEKIIDLQQSDGAVYLFTAPAIALIIPFRVFSTEEERQSFIDYLKLKLRS